MTPAEIYKTITLRSGQERITPTDPLAYAAKRKNSNLRKGGVYADCHGNRQTGRSTQMVITAISNYMLYGKRALFICHDQAMVTYIKSLVKDITTQLDIVLDEFKFFVCVKPKNAKYRTIGSNFTIYEDNVFADINSTKHNITRAPENTLINKFKKLDKILKDNNGR